MRTGLDNYWQRFKSFISPINFDGKVLVNMEESQFKEGAISSQDSVLKKGQPTPEIVALLMSDSGVECYLNVDKKLN